MAAALTGDASKWGGLAFLTYDQLVVHCILSIICCSGLLLGPRSLPIEVQAVMNSTQACQQSILRSLVPVADVKTRHVIGNEAPCSAQGWRGPQLCNVSLLCCIHALQPALQASSFTRGSVENPARDMFELVTACYSCWSLQRVRELLWY
jgi:hypothetical protein